MPKRPYTPELNALARQRRLFLVASVGLCTAVVVLVWASPLLAGRGGEGPSALAVATGLLTAASLLWTSILLEVLSLACPRCGDTFFASPERVLWTLPYLHRSCGHCGLHLAHGAHAGGSERPDAPTL